MPDNPGHVLLSLVMRNLTDAVPTSNHTRAAAEPASTADTFLIVVAVITVIVAGTFFQAMTSLVTLDYLKPWDLIPGASEAAREDYQARIVACGPLMTFLTLCSFALLGALNDDDDQPFDLDEFLRWALIAILSFWAVPVVGVGLVHAVKLAVKACRAVRRRGCRSGSTTAEEVGPDVAAKT